MVERSVLNRGAQAYALLLLLHKLLLPHTNKTCFHQKHGPTAATMQGLPCCCSRLLAPCTPLAHKLLAQQAQPSPQVAATGWAAAAGQPRLLLTGPGLHSLVAADPQAVMTLSSICLLTMALPLSGGAACNPLLPMQHKENHSMCKTTDTPSHPQSWEMPRCLTSRSQQGQRLHNRVWWRALLQVLGPARQILARQSPTSNTTPSWCVTCLAGQCSWTLGSQTGLGAYSMPHTSVVGTLKVPRTRRLH
jgi:hypothetical protein